MRVVRVAGAQLNPVVGDIAGNRDRILDAMTWAEGEGADILVVPELAITGYPPEDLLLRRSFVADNLAAVADLARQSGRVLTVVGFVDEAPVSRHRGGADAVDRRIANAAALLCEGEVRGVYHKELLPNYGVFDEDRYFVPGRGAPQVWDVGGVTLGVSICEDIWIPEGPPSAQAAAGARLLLNINASPYHRGKRDERESLVVAQSQRSMLPVVYLNAVGGQDELVFDGGSLVCDQDGRVVYRAPQFAEHRFWVDIPIEGSVGPGVPVVRRRPVGERDPAPAAPSAEPLAEDEQVYRALQMGLGDYVRKNGFESAVIGLSGGIDSALTAALAVDALGPAAVHGVTMPSRYSSPGSVTDSADLAERLGIRFTELPIDGIFGAYREALAPLFAETEEGTAEENLQARIRGALLMALSNKFGDMVVATGNKSEMAVGYATLYGDMAGGFAVLKDLLKTGVYRLARWRNRSGELIPQAVIDKPPSAELRPDQLDTDALPAYDLLDAILELYIEQDSSPAEVIAAGFDAATVRHITRLVDRNEYKRRQAPPGVKITTKAFGRDRRLPITNRYPG